MSVSPLYNQGTSALAASSAWIAVTGNNVANVNTDGYSRQYVVQEDAVALTTRPGAQGQGVNAKVVLRYYDAFLERSYIEQSSITSRWSEQKTSMASLENLFNESNRTGISTNLTAFFNAWNDLALRPDDTSSRQSLLSYADNLADMIRTTRSNIENIQYSLDLSIKEDVDRVNELATAISDLNNQINRNIVEGISVPNDLFDQRDAFVRDMAKLIDVTTVDNGNGRFCVMTKSGRPLVDGTEVYPLAIMGGMSERQLQPHSTYTGDIIFDGSDAYEYTCEIVQGGDANAGASFRVSLDGGRTWLRNEDNSQMTFPITAKDPAQGTDPVTVKNLAISFSSATGFTKGDTFSIVPKDGLYWIEPTRGPENITPQIGLNGVENSQRTTGGSLSANFNVRDDNCGRYLDELNAFSNALIWEVNRIHTQGGSPDKLLYAQGTYLVSDADAPLGTARSNLPYAPRLTTGNVSFSMFNATTGDWLEDFQLDFDTVTAGIQNFDPQQHSLRDVASAITTASHGLLTANIQNNQLILNCAANTSFTLGTDSSGLMAGLGINTFFEGNSASDIALNATVRNNTNFLCAGALNGEHEIYAGDASIAAAISRLSEQPVTISTTWKISTEQSLSAYYNALVGTVGSDTRTANTNTTYHTTLASDLHTRVESVSGVNLDEEMANLIKFQASYTAAAKLITTADEMLQTVLGLKQ